MSQSPVANNVVEHDGAVEAFYPERLVEELKKAGVSVVLAREVAAEVAHKVYPNVAVNVLRGWVETALEKRSREAAALYRLHEQSKHRPVAKPAYRHRSKPSPRKGARSTGRSKKGRR